MYRLSQLPGRSSVISGELQTGGNSICLCLTLLETLMTPVIRILSMSLTSVSFFLSAVTLGIYLGDSPNLRPCPLSPRLRLHPSNFPLSHFSSSLSPNYPFHLCIPSMSLEILIIYKMAPGDTCEAVSGC
jgi:hypothetical protein